MERDQAVKFIHELLRAMVAKKASDLFITAGFPPAFKLDGKRWTVPDGVASVDDGFGGRSALVTVR